MGRPSVSHAKSEEIWACWWPHKHRSLGQRYSRDGDLRVLAVSRQSSEQAGMGLPTPQKIEKKTGKKDRAPLLRKTTVCSMGEGQATGHPVYQSDHLLLCQNAPCFLTLALHKDSLTSTPALAHFQNSTSKASVPSTYWA